tara:strand:- start:115 stop:879 length:765 start_codon:yes stop_codon:yes gene_type:complete
MSKKKYRAITAATDGACSGNPGPGGWGALIRFEDGSKEEFGGYEPNTTNNRMELTAALKTYERLKELPLHPNIKIKTDSKYLINGLSTWMKNWKKKGWLTASGKPVLNKDLWVALEKNQISSVKLTYVKGHSGEEDNERVDKIAVAFSKKQKIFLKKDTSEKNENKYLNADNNLSLETSNELEILLSKLELITRFSEKGYGLTSEEICKLVNIPIEKVRSYKTSWVWREWIIEPISNELWRFNSKNKDTESWRE